MGRSVKLYSSMVFHTIYPDLIRRSLPFEHFAVVGRGRAPFDIPSALAVPARDGILARPIGTESPPLQNAFKLS